MLGALLFLPAAFADPVEEKRPGLDSLWPGFKAAWNERSIPALLQLHHPDSPLCVDYARPCKRVPAELQALIDKGKDWKLMAFDAYDGSDLLDEIENLQKTA